VIDPFSDGCVVVTGSHNLGYQASYNNDENMAIIKGHRPVAEAYAANALDIYDHYAWRWWLSRNPTKAWTSLKPDDIWQDTYFDANSRPISPELNFWLAAADRAQPAMRELLRRTAVSTAPTKPTEHGRLKRASRVSHATGAPAP
jgi:phosphatidylserine/phosphatidylglycerophosphate/cardiolipin synthase-like enzyme